MLMAPGACKISRGCNILQVPCQVIPLGLPWQSDGLAICIRTKIARPVVFRLAFGFNLRPSAKAHCVARPTQYIHPWTTRKGPYKKPRLRFLRGSLGREFI